MTACATPGETSIATLSYGGATVVRPKESQEAAKFALKVVLPPPRDQAGATAGATPSTDCRATTTSRLFRQVVLVFYANPVRGHHDESRRENGDVDERYHWTFSYNSIF